MEICRTARTQHDMTGPERREDKKGVFLKLHPMLHMGNNPMLHMGNFSVAYMANS